MELKLLIIATILCSAGLLIVLNGIETHSWCPHERCIHLLIVLNGIETRICGPCGKGRFGTFNRTKWNWNTFSALLCNCAIYTFNRTKWNWNQWPSACRFFHSPLLIVLNGIETRLARYYATVQYLLIVLNGIETGYGIPAMNGKTTFNRTKWNWNKATTAWCSTTTSLLIVLNGIETCIFPYCFFHIFLLIVLNGIETIFMIVEVSWI